MLFGAVSHVAGKVVAGILCIKATNEAVALNLREDGSRSNGNRLRVPFNNRPLRNGATRDDQGITQQELWRYSQPPDRLAHCLNAEGYRAVVMDPRGHGETGGTYGFNLHEHHDVAAVAEAIRAGRLAAVASI